ncbi:MAG: NB-ARC domain-containing protein, partial [Rhizonema sp. PD38]|nr:NB-ARC domain-containing protein [Rhizonema sp. PD38]
MPISNSVCVKTILILAAIPNGVRLDTEIRSIEECIRRAVRRDSVNIFTKTAVRPKDIRRALAEEKPQIVHFCGHGLEDGSLLLENDGGQDLPVSPQDLAALFELHKDYVKCVLLNACYSVIAATAISEHIDYAIGMNQQIQDNSAIKFSEGFYDALGYPTENLDGFQRAFKEGKIAITLENPDSAEIPVMKTKINTSQTVIFGNAPRRAGIPFQAPPLPSYYVDRPEYSGELKKRLLTESNDLRTLVVTAIHGLGSIGKSTITTALAHDIDVQAHFSDGILWATLGQKPDTLSLLSGWIQALNDHNFKPTSVDAASSHLRTLLYDKAVLVVVDDAWNPLEAQAFNVGGARCQVLVTTRDKAIADSLGASIYSLDVMTPEQAMELLTKKLGRSINKAEYHSASDLASSVGYLPLALELIAAEVASGTAWTELLDDFQVEVARLKNLNRPGAEEITDEAILKRFSLTASLNLSVSRMPKEKQQQFSWLGVLPEDINITKMMAATLWEIDVRATAKVLQYMHSKALLLKGVPLTDGTPTYRLHDLFHDLACNLLTAPTIPLNDGDLPGLGITLENAHATLLERYRQKTQNNLWHTLPDDGYIHQRLVWHLEKAKLIEDIHLLLQEETESGGNGWYEACDRLGQTANFVTDVARAWQLASEEWTEATLPKVIGLQCRYALIIASLNSLSANLPVKLLLALIQKNVWTPSQGLGYVLQSSNPAQKANLLTEIADHLPPNLKELALSKALAAAREIQDERHRATALSRLAAELPPDLLSEALAAVMEIQDKRHRADALSSLAELPPDLLPEALAAAREIQDESSRAYALSSLADKLPPDLLPEALAAAREIQSKYNRATALSSLAGILPDLLPEALAAAREIQDEFNRVTVLSSLAGILPDLLPEALAAAREIQSESFRATALSSLAAELPPDLLPEALAAAREIQDEYDRATALSSLAGILPDLLPEALAAVREIQDESSRAYALSSLAVKLPPDLLPEALTAAREIQDESSRAYALSSLADKLPPDLLPEALAAAREIQDESSRAYALSSLADKLPPDLLPEALAAAREIQ